MPRMDVESWRVVLLTRSRRTDISDRAVHDLPPLE